MGFITKLKTKINKTFAPEPLFWEYEVQANKIVATIITFCLLVLVVMGALDFFKAIDFQANSSLMNFALESFVWLLVPLILCLIFKGEKRWLKGVMMIGLIAASARLYSIFGFQLLLFMVIPTVLSCVYYSKWLTRIVAVVTSFAFAGATLLNVFYGRIDMNTIEHDRSIDGYKNIAEFVHNNYGQDELYRNAFKYNYVPNLLMFIVISIICVWIAKRCHKMVLDKVVQTKESARIDSELSLATDIQTGILPSSFPDSDNFDIYAIMNPAKEVGGDFYDYFMVDDNKLAIVIGDVSGKGVPAALFMMVAKTLIRNFTIVNPSPAEVFKEVNNALCENNDAGLFVTAWMGIIDFEKSNITFANAGHNPPVIKHKGNKYKFIELESGFVLGGMDGIIYKEHSMELDEGDGVLLYTDGVTEACHDTELYGNGRLLNVVNSKGFNSCKEGIEAILEDIDSFVGDTQQADDVTMLWVKYEKRANNMIDSKKYLAVIENLKEANDFLMSKCDEYNVSPKQRIQLELAFEELFTNVANYSYGDEVGNVEVGIGYEDDTCLLVIKISDKGVPFNPLEKESPDITLNAEDRPIGGLGIFMIKKNVDDITYDYINGENVVTLYKKIGDAK